MRRAPVTDPTGPAGGDAGAALAAAAARAFAWLREDAWPLWLEHGVDWGRGAFHETLDPETLRCPAGYRRLRVAARQTYVFAQAARFASSATPRLGRAIEAVDLGIAFLRGPARHPEGGFAWRFDLDNRPIDPTRDLYDHAFVLLALASAAPVLGVASLRDEALALLAFLDARFAHPYGGYAEAIPPAKPRRQNPHMHLLEACLAAFDAFGDGVFLDRAEALVDLFATRLFRVHEGALAEFFDDALEPLREGGHFIAEPGHHAEWVWLLDWYRASAERAKRRVDADRLAPIEAALYGFVDRWGCAPGGTTLLDVVRDDGAPVERGARLWPQLERLKADIRRPIGAASATADALPSVFAYFQGVPPGLWHERRHENGGFVPGPVPATSLYHLTSAFLDIRARAGSAH